MTWNEKNTIIKALALYRDSQMRKAQKARKNLELKKVADYSAEAGKAQALISVFCELLTIPAGEAKI